MREPRVSELDRFFNEVARKKARRDPLGFLLYRVRGQCRARPAEFFIELWMVVALVWSIIGA